MKFTIFGTSGFIGGNLCKHLQQIGHDVFAPPRDYIYHLDQFSDEDLGHVIYCIGMTADFRSKPNETIDAHILLLSNLLKFGRFLSLNYISSSRVYEGSSNTHECTDLIVNPNNFEHLYNLSKLTAESMCLNSGKVARVIRLSNVYGVGMSGNNFLSVVLRDASRNKAVRFLTSPTSSKDYIAIKNVVELLPQIAIQGKQRIYNLASGENTSNALIASFLEKKHVEVTFLTNAPIWSFPEISIQKLKDEFSFKPNRLENDLSQLYEFYSTKVANNEPH